MNIIFEIRRFAGSGYETVATVYDDATVTGDTAIARRLREAVRRMEASGYDPIENLPNLQRAAELKYSNGYYETVVNR